MPTRATVTTRVSDLILRKAPSLSAESIVGMPNGSTVDVLRENGDWARVFYLEPEKWVKGELKRVRHEGWCHKDYLTYQS